MTAKISGCGPPSSSRDYKAFLAPPPYISYHWAFCELAQSIDRTINGTRDSHLHVVSGVGTCCGARRQLGLMRHAHLVVMLISDDGVGSRREAREKHADTETESFHRS
jgi:hypothetical protein